MSIDVTEQTRFELPDSFLSRYESKQVPWGFGDLSYITFKRTYARELDDGTTEDWWQTCRRVINGMFTVQKTHCKRLSLPWDEQKAMDFAKEAYDRLFHFKWTPPGRGLWTMGTEFLYNRGAACANNCGFTSTKDIDKNYAKPFTWALQMSMLGVGVGYDTRGAGEVTIQEPGVDEDRVFTIGDSREGWAEALNELLTAFFNEDASLPAGWDYSEIRPKGAEIGSFGGTASGPDPLQELLERLETMYRDRIGQSVDSEIIVDTFNLVGKCVVAGGVRRSAMISIGDRDDEQFMDLKLDSEKVRDYRWASNNSVRAEVGMDYEDVARRTVQNGEPGYLWLDNARAYGRMKDDPDWADENALGSNPCVEQTLWDKELCTLVETYPAHHESYEDFQKTLKIAYQYAKTVTLVPTHSPETNAIMLKNRRIGCSMTGIVQAINKHGYREFFDWCDKGYEYIQEVDKKYSDWLCIPRSIKTTSVKPSGTVSLLAGATSGAHWDHGTHYIRRMRMQDNHDILDKCREAGYPVEDDVYSDGTKVVEFPISVNWTTRSKYDVPLWEKVDLAAKLQHYWSDNQVSCTAEFDPDLTTEELVRILEYYEDQLKGISFLPLKGHGYDQPPYEPIGEEEYLRRIEQIDPVGYEDTSIQHDREDKFCSGEACEID